jgi:hypothetical protein
MKSLIATLVAAALILPALAPPSAAQGRDERERHGERERHDEREHGDHRRDGWHGDEIHRFQEHDMERWRGGEWRHGEHDGRVGWWWNVGPSWYLYNQPVYPYPDPYQPPVVAGPAAAPPPPGGQYWYYCRSPAGYYPYVPQCAGPWETVPAG